VERAVQLTPLRHVLLCNAELRSRWMMREEGIAKSILVVIAKFILEGIDNIILVGIEKIILQQHPS
jgi:hypothetical protein